MKLHRKYGVNSTMTTCFICGETTNEIILVGAHTKGFIKAGIASEDGEMPMQIGPINKNPCKECKKHMEQGVILISVRDGESGNDPYRTGNWVVIKKEAVKKVFGKEITGMAFIEDTLWERIGLPNGF